MCSTHLPRLIKGEKEKEREREKKGQTAVEKEGAKSAKREGGREEMVRSVEGGGRRKGTLKELLCTWSRRRKQPDQTYVTFLSSGCVRLALSSFPARMESQSGPVTFIQICKKNYIKVQVNSYNEFLTLALVHEFMQ